MISATLEERHAHAKDFVHGVYVWGASSFYAALSPTRTAQERETIVETIFQKYEACVASDPEEHAFDVLKFQITIEKV